MSGAIISECGKYRYRLWRNLDRIRLESELPLSTVAFVMLNPSTADGIHDDPTIRRCMGFAERWGYHRLEVVNLSPIRATSPKELRRLLRLQGDWQMPSDVMNSRTIEEVVDGSGLVVAAWGAGVVTFGLETRAEEVVDLCDNLKVLGLTKYGHPKHPLYVRRDVEPIEWRRE